MFVEFYSLFMQASSMLKNAPFALLISTVEGGGIMGITTASVHCLAIFVSLNALIGDLLDT
jgi:hypothetical protein